MIELCNYIYNNYPQFQKFPYWRLLSLLDRNQDKIISVKENGKFKGAAMYVKIADDILEGLQKLKNPKLIRELLSDPEFIQGLLQNKGNNVHFLYVLADDMKTIREGVKKVREKEKPKTISWFNPEMTKLYITKEKKLCHQ